MDENVSVMNASAPLAFLAFGSEGWVPDVKYIDSPTKIALLLALTWAISLLFFPRRKRPSAPVFGYRSILEPSILLQARFILGARNIVHNAYQKMRGRIFVVRRYDTDFMVLPIKYLEYIRLMPESKLSARGAQSVNLAPGWMKLEFIYHSNLHIDVLKKKLTPELFKFVNIARGELDYGWHLDLPHTDDWTEVPFEGCVRRLLSRMMGKIFLGEPTCRDPEWTDLSNSFAIDLSVAAFTANMFPPWISWLVVWFIPARYRVFRQIAKVTRFANGLTKRHDEAKEKRLKGEEVEEEDTLLNWMLDHGTASELEPFEMGARLALLSLSSIQTTGPTLANVMYDLCAHPEWFDVLREEIEEIAKDLGPPGLSSEENAREWTTRLEKLDSFLVESQRHNPFQLLNPQRMAYQDITFKDGTFVPKGTIIAFASYENTMDPNVFENPHDFDPMRCYRKRMSSPDQRDLHKAGMTHPNNLNFGYGNQACPGRQFAMSAVKLVMSRLLYEFEFKFLEGMARPEMLFFNENVLTDPSTKLLMRKRRI